MIPTKYTCQSSEDGTFGNTTGTNTIVEIISFRYEMELNMALVNATSGTDPEKTEEEIIPLLEYHLSDILFPFLFQKCNDVEDNSTNLFSNIQGISSQPKDIVGSSDCNTEATSGNVCYPVDARFSLYFQSSLRRRLEQERQEMTKIKEIIKKAMIQGQMNSVHPGIINITYIDTTAFPVVNPGPNSIVVEKNGEYRGSMWWQLTLGISSVGLLLAAAIFIWRKYRKEEEDDDSESCSSS